MRRIFLLITFICTSFINSCFAAPNLDITHWMQIDDTPEVAAWIDTADLRFIKNNYDKIVIASVCLNRKIDDITVFTRIEYNLEREQHRFLKENIYNTYNQLIANHETPSRWMTPDYGTIIYEVDVVLHSMYLAREEAVNY